MRTLPSSSMSNGRTRRIWAWCLAFGFAGLALAASAQPQPAGPSPDANGPIVVTPDAPAPPQPVVQPPPDTWDRFWKIEKVSADDEWTRHFRIGAIVGLNISANFSTKGAFNIAHENGVYDDGYVRVDDTGNAQGLTGYWGYETPGQLSGTTLTMHSATGYDVNSSVEDKGSAFAGFEMAYGGNLWAWGAARIGWEFGFGLMPIKITDNSSMSATVSQRIYTFDTTGIIVPTAPYHGGFNSAGEPTIYSDPLSVTTNTFSGTVAGSHTLDVMLYVFRLGPTVYWDLNEDLGLMVGGGPAVGIMSGSLNYNETASTSTTPVTGTVDGTDVVYGGYVNAMLTWHVEKNGDLYLGAQYMPLGRATISGDGREAQLNLAGQVYVTAGINWTF